MLCCTEQTYGDCDIAVSSLALTVTIVVVLVNA